MRSTRVIGGLGIVAASLGVTLTPSPASALTTVCMARTPATTGKVPWTLRQASGLTSLPGADSILYTHNDRGLRDNPAPGEDTASAAVWAIKPDGTPLARYRLTAGPGGPPIPYFDTEAIGHDPAGHLVLADTGTNVDHRVVVAVYRFTPPPISANQAYVEQDVPAEIIPIAYYNSATTQAEVQLNVESMVIDAAGSAWFIPRKSSRPYAYVATAAALDAASGSSTPARAQRSSRLAVAGPVTDASISPTNAMMVVKTTTTTYAYLLNGGSVATALTGAPACTVATAKKAKDPGYGEAIVAREDGSFTTLAEGSKNAHSGSASAVWSFTP
jgi:hypothetical protein